MDSEDKLQRASKAIIQAFAQEAKANKERFAKMATETRKWESVTIKIEANIASVEGD